ncbi:MAG: hypothetical protein ACRD88_07865 [Terriglobia bacterium]
MDEFSAGEAALNRGAQEEAIAEFKLAAAKGDARAAAALGFIFEAKGREDPSAYELAATWYEKALELDDHPLVHLGLARLYYYALGRSRKFPLAYEQLKAADPEQSPEAALMLGELLLWGAGCEQNIAEAERHFQSAVDAGYPLGLIGLARAAKARGKYLRSFFYMIRAFGTFIPMMFRDKTDPRLLGIRKGGGRLYLDRYVHEHS